MEKVSIINTFKEDVLKGFSDHQKSISPKYFYDDEGSKIFQQIMSMPEYYLTRAEFEILEKYKDEIFGDIKGKDSYFALIELGAGDGQKTNLLLKEFLQQNADFKYVPVDISEEALNDLVSKVVNEMPQLNVTGIAGDYFDVLADLNFCESCRKVILFLGSNIGNYNPSETIGFFLELSKGLNPGDMILTGFDLIKDPRIILNAYNDASGITREFNLNLLRRMNTELGANFNIDNFIHHPVYDPRKASANSYLISTVKQKVYFESLKRSFDFEQWEAIYTEESRKFSLNEISEIASQTGFELQKNYMDSKNYFADSLWVKK
jgi:L-histidine N-alpha-methyltransferase